MRKDYCDKCKKEMNLQHFEGNILSPYINGGKFRYNLQYSYSGNISLHGVENKDKFNKTLDLCISCALELIELIENIHYLNEDN